MNEQEREMLSAGQQAVSEKVSAYEREKQLQSVGAAIGEAVGSNNGESVVVCVDVSRSIQPIVDKATQPLLSLISSLRESIRDRDRRITGLVADGHMTEAMAQHHYKKGSADGHAEGYRVGYNEGARVAHSECSVALNQYRGELATAKQSVKDITRSRDIVSKRLDEVRNCLSHIGAHVSQAREV
jgi:hypothetical protein